MKSDFNINFIKRRKIWIVPVIYGKNLLNFKVKLLKYGYTEGLFSECFCSVNEINLEENQSGLIAFLSIDAKNKDVVLKTVKKFVYLRQASGDGGMYDFLKVNDNKIIENNPVVFFDSDGYIEIAASNFRELLTLLSIDTEPMFGIDEDENTSFYRDEDEEHSEEYETFVKWLEERDIAVIRTLEEIETIGKVIIDNAVQKYNVNLQEILSSLY